MPKSSGYLGTEQQSSRPSEKPIAGFSWRQAPQQSCRTKAGESPELASDYKRSASGPDRSPLSSKNGVATFPCVLPSQRQPKCSSASKKQNTSGLVGNPRALQVASESAAPFANESSTQKPLKHNSAAAIVSVESRTPSTNENSLQKQFHSASAILGNSDVNEGVDASFPPGQIDATEFVLIQPSPEPQVRLPSTSPTCGSGSSPGPSVSCERRVEAARWRSDSRSPGPSVSECERRVEAARWRSVSSGRSTPHRCNSRSSSGSSRHILYKNGCRPDGPSGFMRIALGNAMLTGSEAFSESEQTVLASCLQEYLNGSNVIPLAKLEDVLRDCCRRLNYPLPPSLLRTLASIGRRVALADGLAAVSLEAVCSLLDEAKEYAMRQQRSFLAKALRQISPPQRGSVGSCGKACSGGFESLRNLSPRRSYIKSDIE